MNCVIVFEIKRETKHEVSTVSCHVLISQDSRRKAHPNTLSPFSTLCHSWLVCQHTNCAPNPTVKGHGTPADSFFGDVYFVY